MNKSFPYVHVVLYKRLNKQKMVGLVFYNFHEIFNNCNYVKYFIKDNRVYFDFTNEKDIHTFKLTYIGDQRVTNYKDSIDVRYPRKFQLATDEQLLPFCGRDYPPYYDDECSLYYIENTIKSKKLF